MDEHLKENLPMNTEKPIFFRDGNDFVMLKWRRKNEKKIADFASETDSVWFVFSKFTEIHSNWLRWLDQ